MSNSKKQLHEFLALDSRIDRIQKETFYEYSQARIIWRKCLILMKQPLNKPKTRGMLFTGDPDGGKSTVTRQFIPVCSHNVPNIRQTDIELYSIPPRLHSKGVMAKLCKNLGIPDIPINYKKNDTHYYIKKAAAKLRTDRRILIIDEFQNLFEISSESRREILSSFNALINYSRIPIVLVGVTGVDEILKNIEDDTSNLRGTFSSRFPEFKLRKWLDKDEEEFCAILMNLYNDLHLQLPPSRKPFYVDNQIRESIIELTDGLLGRIIHLIKETAIQIIFNELQETITTDLLIQTAEELELIDWNVKNSIPKTIDRI